MKESAYLSSWIDEVYLPRLHSRDSDLIYDRHSPWEAGDRFSERFLQIIWNERYLNQDLTCIDGTPLRIVHPGTWNVAAGPDFLNAAIILNGTLRRGDVEIHQRTSDWNHHGHGGDPLYGNIILHVVWEHDGDVPGAPSPTFMLNGNIPPSWHILLQDVEDACYPYARQVSTGQCALKWALTDDASLRSVLSSAGLARLEAKGKRLLRRCADHGTDQALYECFFDCLGFRNNRQPFCELAEMLPIEQLRGYEPLQLEAIFFGTAGLLPDMTQEPVLPEWKHHVQQLWDIWWQLGHSKLDLPWHTAGSRPFNSPHRRLAAGIAWLIYTDFHPFQWIASMVQASHEPRQLLRNMMTFHLDTSVWNGFRDFKTRLKQPASLLGHARLQDITANLLLPFVCAHGLCEEENDPFADLARKTYILLPPGQDNRFLTEASHRFLVPPSRSRQLLKRYCHQQGLLDMYRNFCMVFNSDCSSCPFVTGIVS